jgi:hypothetical protein
MVHQRFKVIGNTCLFYVVINLMCHGIGQLPEVPRISRITDGRHGDKPESPTTRTRTWPKGPTPLWSRPLLLLLRALLSFQNIATARGEGR